MSKPWKPPAPKAKLRTSRIRREPLRRTPVREPTRAEIEKAEARAREREVWGGVVGVVLFALGITGLAVAMGAATLSDYDPAAAAAEAARFGQCYNSGRTNCVVDGGTIFVGGEKLAVAGVAAPAIHGAQCEAERTQGIAAAMALADLLNRGTVGVGPAIADTDGRAVRTVTVNGEDVAAAMVNAGLARKPGSAAPAWCG